LNRPRRPWVRPVVGRHFPLGPPRPVEGPRSAQAAISIHARGPRGPVPAGLDGGPRNPGKFLRPGPVTGPAGPRAAQGSKAGPLEAVQTLGWTVPNGTSCGKALFPRGLPAAGSRPLGPATPASMIPGGSMFSWTRPHPRGPGTPVGGPHEVARALIAAPCGGTRGRSTRPFLHPPHRLGRGRNGLLLRTGVLPIMKQPGPCGDHRPGPRPKTGGGSAEGREAGEPLGAPCWNHGRSPPRRKTPQSGKGLRRFLIPRGPGHGLP